VTADLLDDQPNQIEPPEMAAPTAAEKTDFPL